MRISITKGDFPLKYINKEWPRVERDRSVPIARLCELQSIVTHAVFWKDGGAPYAADCFCKEQVIPDEYFQHEGHSIQWIEQAVLEKLEREGHIEIDREKGK